MSELFLQNPEKALHGKTHAAEWEARCFSATIAAPVTSGVSFGEREITSLVGLEDIGHKISVSSDVECFTEVPGSPLSSVPASYSSSLHSNPLSGRFLSEYYHGKSPSWLRDVCKQCPPKQMQPSQSSLTIKHSHWERVVKTLTWTDSNLFYTHFPWYSKIVQLSSPKEGKSSDNAIFSGLSDASSSQRF